MNLIESLQVVKVVWADAKSAHSQWEDLSTIADEGSLAEIVSVGLLAQETDDLIQLVQSVDLIDNHGAEVLHIPKGCIKELSYLTEPVQKGSRKGTSRKRAAKAGTQRKGTNNRRKA